MYTYDCCIWEIKYSSYQPMDSFGTWRKWKLIFYFFVNAEIYSVVWTFNALLTVRSEILPFSGNNQNIKMFGVPPNTLPWVMYIMIICHWAILHYNMSFQTINWRKVWWCFLMISCTFWRSRKNLSNSPKLSCGMRTSRSRQCQLKSFVAKRVNSILVNLRYLRVKLLKKKKIRTFIILWIITSIFLIFIYNEKGSIRKVLFCIIQSWQCCPYFKNVKNGA